MSLRLLLIACLLAPLSLTACRHTPAAPEAAAADAERQPFSATPAFPGWIAACGNGEAEPCGALLSSIFFSGRTELLAEGKEAFTRACDAGVADGCTGAILSGLSEENPNLDAEGLNRACAAGSRFACLMQLPMEYQATPDLEALSALLERHAAQCEEEGGVRCSVVSSAFETGTGVEADAARARSLAQKGCEEQDPTSCYQLGLILHDSVTRDASGTDDAQPSNADDAGAASADAATAGEASAEGDTSGATATSPAPSTPETPKESKSDASPEAVATEKPESGARSQEQEAAAAREAFENACDGRVGPACLNAAHLLFTGFGGEADPEAARLRAWQACELGERDACDLLALTDEGRHYPPRPEGATSDAERISRLQEKYCGLGGPQACTARGVALAKEAQDTQRYAGMDAALDWLVKGCSMEGQQACQLLFSIASGSIQACDQDSRPDRCLVAGYIHERSAALPPGLTDAVRADASRATEAFTRACEGGQGAACDRLKKAPAPAP